MINKLLKSFGYILLCGIITNGFAVAQILAVPQKYQEQDQWCWAGSSQAILEYYGVIKTQTEIAQYGTDGANIWNYLWGSTTNPTRNGINLILNYFGSINSTGITDSCSLVLVTSEISNRRPIVVRWGWDSGGGHFVVIHGVADTIVYLMDPWYGPTISSYAWVCKGSSHTWTHSLKINTTPPSSVENSDHPIYGYTLSQNFPNPFNPATTISFSLPSKSFVSLKVFDLLGKEITNIFSGEMAAGNYSRQWNGSELPSGVYFYRLQARAISGGQTGSFTETRKLILAK